MIRHFRLLKLIFYKGRKDHILATYNDNCKYKQVQKPHTQQVQQPHTEQYNNTTTRINTYGGVKEYLI